MEISLTPELEEFVQEKVHAGHFADPSEVVREALELLRGQDDLTPDELEALRREIAIGVDQLDRGEGTPWDAEDIKARGLQRLASKTKPN